MTEGKLSEIQEAVTENPQAILLDMDTLGDGYEICRKLAEYETTRGVPVLVWTEKSGEEETLRAKEAGAKDCIVKGATTDELRAIIESIEKTVEIQEKPVEEVMDEGTEQEQPEENESPVEPEESVEEKSVENDEMEQEAQQEAVSPSEKKILAVSYDEEISASIKRLSDSRYRPLFLEDPEELIRTAMGEKPDVVLLDGEIEGIDSFNMYKILNARMSSTPVLMLLGARQEYRTQDARVSEYLIKPFAYEDLVKKLERILG